MSAGLRRLSGKGERVIIVHMGTSIFKFFSIQMIFHAYCFSGNEKGWAPNSSRVWIRRKVCVFQPITYSASNLDIPHVSIINISFPQCENVMIFFVIQILREINFGEARSCKTNANFANFSLQKM